METRVGVLLMPTESWADTKAHVRRLEALGYDHLWIYDHLMWRHYRDHPWHATYPWLTAVATCTDRIRLGTMVANPNLRHPLVLARDAATIDHVSGGRFILGVGAGGVGYDAGALGQAPLSPRRRADRLVEYVRVLDGLLTGSLTDHEGDTYTVVGARMEVGCVQQPRLPIVLAATGPRTLALVAERADGWITYGDAADLGAAATMEAVRRQWGRIEDRCLAIDRDPAEITRTYLIGHAAERPLSSVEAFVDFVGRYTELGFTDIVFHHPRADDPVWNEPPEIVDQVAERLNLADRIPRNG